MRSFKDFKELSFNQNEIENQKKQLLLLINYGQK